VIECIRCAKVFKTGERVVEFAEAIMVDEGFLEPVDDAEVCYFCPECFDAVCRQASKKETV